jgi:4-amino-4-deoxy-L-arabinose transferase-like glycosyltransferase
MHWKQNQILKNLILLLVIVIPLFSLGISNHGLWSADEPRVAEIGREMLLTGNWAVPTLNQKPFLEEPPLYYGALALTFKAFGISDKVARIPSAFFTLASILVVFFMANFLFGPRMALFSALILATTGEYFRVAHTVIVDSALTFFIVSSMGLFIVGYLSDNNRKKLLSYILMYVSCSLAFFTKGFIGIVLPGLGILAFLVADRNIKEIFKMRLWLGALIFLFMTLPWFIALWHQGGTEHLDVFLIHNPSAEIPPRQFLP